MSAGSRPPHLVYVAWGFPPSRGGGVYRALATANAFAEAGWDVTVVTITREAFAAYTGVDPSLEQRVDSRITVERLPFSLSAHDTDIRQYGFARAFAPLLWRRARLRLDQMVFPEVGYGPWRRELEPALERIHARHPADLVIATANPHVAFAGAFHLHERFGVPYVMDYRDAWLLDVFSGRRLHGERSRAAAWEQRLIEHAAEVWFVNEPILSWHVDLYPDQATKFHVVANGFDADVAPEPHLETPGDADNGLTFGYIGTVGSRVPLRECLDGWQRARQRDSLVARSRVEFHGYLGYYRVPTPALRIPIDEHADEDVHYMGPVAKADIRAVYSRFDALLLVLGTGRYVTSGKVYEYTASALPIVSVHDPGNAASDVLRGYPLWFPARSLEPDDVAEALIAGAAAACSADTETRRSCREFADKYRRERQLGPRVAALTDAIAPQLAAAEGARL